MKRELQINKQSNIHSILDTIQLWIQTIPNGEWILKLEKAKKHRSLSQNALLWVWMDILSKEWAEATGEYFTKDQFKEMFARKFLPIDSPLGVVGRNTSTLTKEEMTDFMTNIQAYVATEWGITLLGEEDRMFNEWRKQYD